MSGALPLRGGGMGAEHGPQSLWGGGGFRALSSPSFPQSPALLGANICSSDEDAGGWNPQCPFVVPARAPATMARGPQRGRVALSVGAWPATRARGPQYGRAARQLGARLPTCVCVSAMGVSWFWFPSRSACACVCVCGCCMGVEASGLSSIRPKATFGVWRTAVGDQLLAPAAPRPKQRCFPVYTTCPTEDGMKLPQSGTHRLLLVWCTDGHHEPSIRVQPPSQNCQPPTAVRPQHCSRCILQEIPQLAALALVDDPQPLWTSNAVGFNSFNLSAARGTRNNHTHNALGRAACSDARPQQPPPPPLRGPPIRVQYFNRWPTPCTSPATSVSQVRKDSHRCCVCDHMCGLEKRIGHQTRRALRLHGPYQQSPFLSRETSLPTNLTKSKPFPLLQLVFFGKIWGLCWLVWGFLGTIRFFVGKI